MKAFLLACLTAVVVAGLGVVALGKVQKPVEQAYTTSGVRL